MYYIPYMILKNQLMDVSKAKLIIEGVEVFFEKAEQANAWKITAHIHFECDNMTKGLIETIEALDFVTIKQCKAHLKAFPSDGVVALVKETRSLQSFSQFKETMRVFMELFDFWKSVVDDVVKSRNLLACSS